MSPHGLTDDSALTGEAPDPTAPERPRLTVREMQLALTAARGLACTDPHGTPVPERGWPVGESGWAENAEADRAAPRRPELEDRDLGSATTVRSAAETMPRSRRGPTVTTAPAPPATTGQWVPDHDGPVSLTGISAPRTRSVRRPAARPDKAARRSGSQRHRPPAKTTVLDDALAARVAAAPPVVVLVRACGGAGVTTTAALLATALASATSTVLVGAGTTGGSTSVRVGANAGDVAMLSEWVRQARGPLNDRTPGIAIAECGPFPFLVAAGPCDRRGQVLPTRYAERLVELARGDAPAAVVVDWAGGDVPTALLVMATHLVVVAPSRSPGLLAAEYTFEQLAQSRAGDAALSVLTVDVVGRARGHAGRAAVARLQALNVPTLTVPFDPSLSSDPGVRWASLRPRTRSAAVAALSHLLQGKDPT